MHENITNLQHTCMLQYSQLLNVLLQELSKLLIFSLSKKVDAHVYTIFSRRQVCSMRSMAFKKPRMYAILSQVSE